MVDQSYFCIVPLRFGPVCPGLREDFLTEPRPSVTGMFDRHQYAGLWWEPERESGVLLGTLTIGQGRPVLEVQEDFGQTLVPETERGRNYLLEKKSRIVGGDDESLITLEEVQGIGRGAQGMGPRTAYYDAQVALEGKRFAKGERVGFDEISIRASDLNAWTQVSGFKTILESESVDEKDRVVATEIRYEAPEDIRIPLAQGEEITISFVCMGRVSAGAATESNCDRNPRCAGGLFVPSACMRPSSELARSETSSASRSVARSPSPR